MLFHFERGSIMQFSMRNKLLGFKIGYLALRGRLFKIDTLKENTRKIQGKYKENTRKSGILLRDVELLGV